MNDKWPTSISKYVLWNYVKSKIKFKINVLHIFGVIYFLFDEILKDLKAGKKIKIYNFGILSLEPTKPRKYFDVRFQKVVQGESHKILKFILRRKLRIKIAQFLDLDKLSNRGKDE